MHSWNILYNQDQYQSRLTYLIAIYGYILKSRHIVQFEIWKANEQNYVKTVHYLVSKWNVNKILGQELNLFTIK